jgi:hypothetical protein
LMLAPACFFSLYYVLGPLIFHALQRSTVVKCTFVIAFIVTLIFVSSVYPVSTKKLFNYHLSTLPDPISGMVLGITGTFSFLWLADILDKSMPKFALVFRYIGKNSFSFFALHLLAFFLCKRALSWGGVHSYSVVNPASVAFALLFGFLHSSGREVARKNQMPPFLKAFVFASTK